MSLNMEKAVQSVWIRVIALIATVLIPFLLGGLIYFAHNTFESWKAGVIEIKGAFSTFVTSTTTARENIMREVGNLDGRINLIEQFVYEGGRYTQEEANADNQQRLRDVERQNEINRRQTELLERLDTRLRQVEQIVIHRESVQ